jgi:oxygen-independent coproporphyrinogen-3 oxidase
MSPTSIYLHIPFCKHRCAYCDFNTYAGQESLIPQYVDSLIREIEGVGESANQRVSACSNYQLPITTVFFGGGTPSLLSAPQFDSILRALRSAFALTADAEISIEANPGTLSLQKLDEIRKTGINRISLGIQSANTEELRMLERIHDFFTVIESVSAVRKAGFDNLNLDLIYGLPEQTLSSWKTTLSRVIDLHPEHLSAYALTLEHGTPFGKWSSKGLLPIPDPDLAAEMYEYAEEFLKANGYVHYEISNWGLDGGPQTIDRTVPSTVYRPPSFACKHNLQYWRSLPYLGFGAGAHGYADGYRYSNVLRIKTYIERMSNELRGTSYEFPLSPAVVNQHRQTRQDDISDYMINNLRLTQAGVAESDFRARFGMGLLEVFGKEIEELIRLGLLESKTSEVPNTSEVYRLTKRGRLLGNQVFVKFV